MKFLIFLLQGVVAFTHPFFIRNLEFKFVGSLLVKRLGRVDVNSCADLLLYRHHLHAFDEIHRDNEYTGYYIVDDDGYNQLHWITEYDCNDESTFVICGKQLQKDKRHDLLPLSYFNWKGIVKNKADLLILNKYLFLN
jgi:hypothetical protein